jgi:tetratricopeptide (TPR) repeat protein
MLETVRQYALERLQEGGGEHAARDRHLAFYLRLVEGIRSELVGPQQARCLEQLDRELDNLLAAHAWCAHTAEGAQADLRLIFSIKLYFLSRGLLALGERLSIEALQRPGANDLLRGRCLTAAGQFLFYRGHYAQARRYLEESLQIARATGEPARVVGALQPLGMACLGEGDLVAARRYLQEAFELSGAIDAGRARVGVINALVQLHRVEERFEEAERLCDDALAIARGQGDEDSVAVNLLNKAMLAIGRRPPAEARQFLAAAVEIARTIGSRVIGQSALETGSVLALLLEDLSRAVRWFAASQRLAWDTGLHRDPADEAFLRPYINRLRELAESTIKDAAASANGSTLDDVLGELARWLSAVR